MFLNQPEDKKELYPLFLTDPITETFLINEEYSNSLCKGHVSISHIMP